MRRIFGSVAVSHASEELTKLVRAANLPACFQALLAVRISWIMPLQPLDRELGKHSQEGTYIHLESCCLMVQTKNGLFRLWGFSLLKRRTISPATERWGALECRVSLDANTRERWQCQAAARQSPRLAQGMGWTGAAPSASAEESGNPLIYWASRLLLPTSLYHSERNLILQ